MLTDSSGKYEIELSETDSIWFSYLEKPTKKFSVKEIEDPAQFNISILVDIGSLPGVKVQSRDYKMDSLQNRMDYAKAFNYRKPDFKSIVPVVGLTIIVDIDELMRAFQYQKKHRALDFQKRLIEQEKEKFTDHRFNKSLVARITGSSGAERDSFMVHYRPSYQFAKTADDYDFQSYIKKSFEKFRQENAARRSDE